MLDPHHYLFTIFSLYMKQWHIGNYWKVKLPSKLSIVLFVWIDNQILVVQWWSSIVEISL